jgi:hypothetical protein
MGGIRGELGREKVYGKIVKAAGRRGFPAERMRKRMAKKKAPALRPGLSK